jgi:hypothetical protein
LFSIHEPAARIQRSLFLADVRLRYARRPSAHALGRGHLEGRCRGQAPLLDALCRRRGGHLRCDLRCGRGARRNQTSRRGPNGRVPAAGNCAHGRTGRDRTCCRTDTRALHGGRRRGLRRIAAPATSAAQSARTAGRCPATPRCADAETDSAPGPRRHDPPRSALLKGPQGERLGQRASSGHEPRSGRKSSTPPASLRGRKARCGLAAGRRTTPWRASSASTTQPFPT